MNDQELRDLWTEEAPHSPTAFTVGELKDRGAESTSIETRMFLERLLLERRDGHVFRLAVLGLAIFLAIFFRSIVGAGSWTLPLLFCGAVAALMGRELVAFRDTRRALAATRVTDETFPTRRLSLRSHAPVIAVATVLTSAFSGTAYWAWGHEQANALRVERAFARDVFECLDTRLSDPQLSVAACERVLGAKPGHTAVVARLAALRTEGECREHIRFATQKEEQGFRDQALAEFSSLGPDCSEVSLRFAIVAAKELVVTVSSEARSQCLEAISSEQWGEAVDRCGAYARYACRGKTAESLEADAAFLGLLRARDRLGLTSAAPWECPDGPVLRELAFEGKPDVWVQRYVPALHSAALAFADARLDEAKTLASRVQTNDAREMLRDIEVVRAWIYVDQPRVDGPVFREALAAEARLVGRLDRTMKATRLGEAIASPLVRERYNQGASLANLQEWREACLVWREGFSFTRSDTNLLRVLTNNCTKRAASALSEAESCEELTAVLDFAVEGDGFREQVEQRQLAAKCSVVVDALRAAVETAPENAEAWLALARANERIGRTKDAAVAYRKYLELRPPQPQLELDDTL